jgi:hypothetical protein
VGRVLPFAAAVAAIVAQYTCSSADATSAHVIGSSCFHRLRQILCGHGGRDVCLQDAAPRNLRRVLGVKAAAKHEVRLMLAVIVFHVCHFSTNAVVLLCVRLTELISQYKSAASSSSSGPGSSSSAASSAAGSSSSAAAGGRQGRLQMNSEGLPLRPGVGNCQHYMKHGWCVFKQDCWYNHPERYMTFQQWG